MAGPDPQPASGLLPGRRTALVAGARGAALSTARSELRRLGWRIVEASNGADAMALLADRRPNLLLLDWQLPIVPAQDVLGAARDGARSHAPALPVVVTMAEPTGDSVGAALALGADAVVAAPFSPATLRGRLEAALDRAAR